MFYVYVLQCSDGSLYTGYTNNLEKRLASHKEGRASKYTRSRLPVSLVAHWDFTSKSQAMKHEIYLKSLSREQKLNIIKLRAA